MTAARNIARVFDWWDSILSRFSNTYSTPAKPQSPIRTHNDSFSDDEEGKMCSALYDYEGSLPSLVSVDVLYNDTTHIHVYTTLLLLLTFYVFYTSKGLKIN